MSGSNSIRKEDVFDTDFVDAEELSSDGYFSYKTVPLVSTTGVTKTVITNPSTYDILQGVDASVEVGDKVYIYGNAADGYYTVATIVDDVTFTVLEDIVNSAGGSCQFLHPAGALRVGFNSLTVNFTNADNVQEALEDLDGYLPGFPNGVGQLLFAIAPNKFSVAMPVTSNQGWLINDQGILLVNQVYDDDPPE